MYHGGVLRTRRRTRPDRDEEAGPLISGSAGNLRVPLPGQEFQTCSSEQKATERRAIFNDSPVRPPVSRPCSLLLRRGKPKPSRSARRCGEGSTNFVDDFPGRTGTIRIGHGHSEEQGIQYQEERKVLTDAVSLR
jgi:hypothetical protein